MPRAYAENEILDLCMNFICVHQSERVCPLILIFFLICQDSKVNFGICE